LTWRGSRIQFTSVGHDTDHRYRTSLGSINYQLSTINHQPSAFPPCSTNTRSSAPPFLVTRGELPTTRQLQFQPPLTRFIVQEDGFTLPDQQAIAGTSANFAISVEKPVDLNSWSPCLMQNSSDPVMAYYRLRIQH